MVVDAVVAPDNEALGLGIVAPHHTSQAGAKSASSRPARHLAAKAIALGEGAVARDSRAASYRPLSYVPPVTTGVEQSAANLGDLVPREGGAAPAAPVAHVLLKGGVLVGALSGVGSDARGECMQQYSPGGTILPKRTPQSRKM